MTNSLKTWAIIYIYYNKQQFHVSHLHFCYVSLAKLTGCAGLLRVKGVFSLPLSLIVGCFQLLLKLCWKGRKHLRVHLVEKRKFKVKPELTLYRRLVYIFHKIDFISNHTFLICMN